MHRFAPLLVLAVLTAGCASSSGSPTAHAASTEPTTSVPTAGSSATTATAAPTAAGPSSRAIYYLDDSGRGPRLYREFHPRPPTTAVVRDAVTAMLTVTAYDKDYTSLWPTATSVLGARISGGTAYVDLSGQARNGHAGAAGEDASLQQLVYTVTAAAPSVRSVQLLIEGRAVQTLWGHVDTRQPMARRLAAEILGPVWVLVPRSIKTGARFGGEASVFEATVSWEFRQGDRVVKSGHTNADMGAPGRGPWSDVANLPPGEYVLRAYESSAKDGTPTFIDDKPVTVTS